MNSTMAQHRGQTLLGEPAVTEFNPLNFLYLTPFSFRNTDDIVRVQ